MTRASVSTKLLLYTLAITAISLVGVGYLIDRALLEYHRETAQREIMDGFSVLQQRIREVESELTEEARTIAEEEQVVAVLNLINSYQDPGNYNHILFDEEKKKIGNRLLAAIKTGEADEAFIYDSKDELASFVATGPGGYSLGVVSYDRSGNSQHVISGGATEIWKGEAVGPAVASRTRQHREDRDGIDHHKGRNGLLIEYHQPVVRSLPDGTSSRVGTLVLANWLDDKFIQAQAKSTVSFGIIDHYSNILVENPGMGLLAQSQRDKLLSHNEPGVIFFETREGFLGTMVMPLPELDRVHLISMYPMSVYRDASRRTRWVVVMALLLVAIVIIPLSLVILRRLITKPMKQLMAGVDGLRSGDYTTRVELNSRDELGELATAMNLMADGIRERERDLNAIIDHVPLMLFVKDAKHLRFVNFNAAGEKLIGKSREEVIGKGDHDFFPAEQADFFIQKDIEVFSRGEVLDISEEYIDTPRGRRILHTRKVPIYDEMGGPRYLLGVSEDITERKELDRRLRQWVKVFDSTSEAVVITDLEANIQDVNKAFSNITGYTKEEVVGENPRKLKSGRHERDFYLTMWDSIIETGSWRGEIWNRRKNGEIFPVWQTISTVNDEKGDPTNYVSVFSDISPIKKTQQKLDFLAHHDPLTELPNRLLLNDRMQHAIDRASREKKGVAVMFLDLDRFKNINDSLGHPVGDALLQEVATRLRSTLREVDSISRQGGDEFVMVLEDIENPDSVVATARKILQLFEQPFMVSGREMIITASLGISLYPEDGDDVITLIRNADAAMYRAKENGRNRFWFYTEDITRHAALRVDMEQALRDTVNHGELVLHYQPQIDLKTLQVVGVEALVRWDRPGHGLVMPDTFIPLAEETRVIDAIGEWVIYSACRQMKHWQERGARLARMAINISPVQISHGNLVPVIEAALNATGLAPEHLELEVTEAIFLRDTDKAARVLRELDEFGVRLALDDFGTGFSSLSYLKNFHFDRLKIDRSFIQEALDKSSDRSIANSVIALGHSLGMVVVAEGIEVEEQLEWLQEKGCDEGQGYFFSKPVSAQEIVQLLNC
jgi:diguanylate cyclase (GGDEF)-like protein/PAS domain S-box-containing protein